MDKEEENRLLAPKVAMAWVKVATVGLGVLVTIGGIVASACYGKYEMDQNADLTKRLSEADLKQAQSVDEIQKLRDQLWDLKKEALTYKSVNSNETSWHEVYTTCEQALKTYKDADAISNYINTLETEEQDTQGRINQINTFAETTPMTAADRQQLADLQKSRAALQTRVADAQKRLICPQ